MLRVIKIRADYGSLKGSNRNRIIESRYPTFSWGVISSSGDNAQTAYAIRISAGKKLLWETDWSKSNCQSARYDGAPLPLGERLTVAVRIRDKNGEESPWSEEYCFYGNLGHEAPSISWISAGEDIERKTVYFKKEFTCDKPICAAVLFVCGIGYHKITVDGMALDNAHLDPAHSDYSKTCYYTVLPEIEKYFTVGTHVIGVILGEGWRRNFGPYLKRPTPDFFGTPQLWAALRLTDADGNITWITTDSGWLWGRGGIAENNLFDGECYDANQSQPDWDTVGGGTDFLSVAVTDAPCKNMRPMTLEPIIEHKSYQPIALFRLENGAWAVDFGQNIAGVIRLKLPKLCKNQKITIRHMEFLDEDGHLYLKTLRDAKATDTYIASGDERDLTVWQPEFVYHGFRYAEITGIELLELSDIQAVSIYTDLDCRSDFRCGNPLLDRIHKNVVQTERSNMHSILTDCPQRDERMGWMNDATVRFEETPFNFDIGKMFPKVVDDLLDSQQQGAISSTAPYVFGSHPADPVCSSFLVAAREAYYHTGNRDILAHGYQGFCDWEEYLGTEAEDYIVGYSKYGDWAGPVTACVGGDIDACQSATVPGTLMSTGYYYYNAKTLTEFSEILGKPEKASYYTRLAENIKAAFLKKWFDPETARVAGGSQGTQSFALWLGILPEKACKRAAKVMRDAVVDNNYKLTTGNLTTRYLMDMLAKYGYENEMYKLLTQDKYPSLGYMIQHEATTVWERFELKKEYSMNSHNHPMYGALDYVFYAYFAGIKPTAAAFDEVEIAPVYPTDLLSVQASVDTVRGMLTVKWVKRYGACHLYVELPFGTTATVHTPNGAQRCGSGFHHFSWQL